MGVRSLRSQAMSWRARARCCSSPGKTGACSGAGHLSSRYSTIALDSDSEKSPSTRAGTRAVNEVCTYAVERCPPSCNSTVRTSNGSFFSVNATKQERTYGLVHIELPWRTRREGAAVSMRHLYRAEGDP